MKASRRGLLKAGAFGLGLATSLAAPGQAMADPGLVITDTRLPEGRALADWAAMKGLTAHDIADHAGELWPMVKALPQAGRITAVTGWSDLVVLRGLLEDRGLRLVNERRLRHRGPRMATPFSWEMTARG